MRLQEVLKEREVEINTLEEDLRKRNDGASRVQPSEPSDLHELSPLTMDHFSALRTSIIHELPDDETDSGVASKRPSLGRLDELMRYPYRLHLLVIPCLTAITDLWHRKNRSTGR